MTDCVLTSTEVDGLEFFAKRILAAMDDEIDGMDMREVWTGGDPLSRLLDIIASHRLLQKRVKELETTIGWYEAKHPND